MKVQIYVYDKDTNFFPYLFIIHRLSNFKIPSLRKKNFWCHVRHTAFEGYKKYLPYKVHLLSWYFKKVVDKL